MIRFVNVHKAFGPKRVLNGLSMDIQKGEVFFILGKSGTGKSVTLKHLVGLLKPDAGEVLLDGEPLHTYNEEQFIHVRRKCGIVFQLPALIDSRSVFDNLTFGIRDLPVQEKVERCKKILHEVNLDNLFEHMGERFPPQLSYGEQKRLAIARTLLIDPDYILYDEPTTGIDPHISKAVHRLIRSVSKNLGKTSVVVSHDMRNALLTADKIVVVDAGQVVDKGTPREIIRSEHPMTKSFLTGLTESIFERPL